MPEQVYTVSGVRNWILAPVSNKLANQQAAHLIFMYWPRGWGKPVFQWYGFLSEGCIWSFIRAPFSAPRKLHKRPKGPFPFVQQRCSRNPLKYFYETNTLGLLESVAPSKECTFFI